MKSSIYHFPGLWSFIHRVAVKRKLPHLWRARDIWHCQQVQNDLAYLPKCDRDDQRKLIKRVLEIRESLAVTLKGMDEAISEVVEKFDLYDEEKQP